MKIYISSDNDEDITKLSKFSVSEDLDEADVVIISPGGLRAYYDLFRAINEAKDVYLYNKDFFYTPIIKNLYDLHLKGIIEKVPSEYINIESELDKIIEKLKER